MFDVFIAPNFNLNMSLNEFILQVGKMQDIINKVSIPSSKGIMAYFNMIFNWALETGNISSTQHPILDRKLKKRKMTRAEQQAEKRADIAEKYLEPSEANRVIEIVESWEERPNAQTSADVFRFMFITGVRPSEALGINEDMIDFDKKTIKIYWQRNWRAKSDKEMFELGLTDEKERYRDDLKTTESVREIPLTPKVEALLKKYIERNEFMKKFNPNYQDMRYIFTCTSVQGTTKQGIAFVQNELSTLLRGGSIQRKYQKNDNNRCYPDIDDLVEFDRPIHILPHIFQHTFVSILAANSLPLSAIREQVGHSEDSKEIEKIYMHVTKKTRIEIEKSVTQLESVLK